MLKRIASIGTAALFLAFLSSGTAFAQDDDDDDMEMDDDDGDGDDDDMDDDDDDDVTVDGGDGDEGDGDEGDDMMMGGAWPMEEVLRPQLLPKSTLSASVGISLAGGPDDMGEYGIGNWIGLDLKFAYGISDKIQVGLSLPLTIVEPDDPMDIFAPLGGVSVEGMYSIMPELAGVVSIGFSTPFGFQRNPYIFPAYVDGDSKIGFSFGANYKRLLIPKMSIQAGAHIVYQADSAVDDMGMPKAFLGLQVPILAYYQVMPALAVGLHTGIYTGEGFSFSADENMTIPFMIEVMYTLMDGKLDVGGNLGFANLITDDMGGIYPGVGDSLGLGISMSYRHGL